MKKLASRLYVWYIWCYTTSSSKFKIKKSKMKIKNKIKENKKGKKAQKIKWNQVYYSLL